MDVEILEKIRVMKEEGLPEMEGEIRELIRKGGEENGLSSSSQSRYNGLLREAILANAERGKMAIKKVADKSMLTKKHLIQTGLTGMARLVKNAASTVDEAKQVLEEDAETEEATMQELEQYKTEVTVAGRIVSRLQKEDAKDVMYIGGGFTFFLACVLYILSKRLRLLSLVWYLFGSPESTSSLSSSPPALVPSFDDGLPSALPDVPVGDEHFQLEDIERAELEDTERLEMERLEKERLEKERLEKERLENQRLENQRLENQRLENQRLENQRLEKERLEQQGQETKTIDKKTQSKEKRRREIEKERERRRSELLKKRNAEL